MRALVGPSVGPSVMLSLFGLLGATYAVSTVLFFKNLEFELEPEEIRAKNRFSRESILRVQS